MTDLASPTPADTRRLDPTDSAAHTALEAELEAAGDHAGRYRLLLDLAARHPADVEGGRFAARAAEEARAHLGDAQLVREACRVALARDPSNVEVLVALCDADREASAFPDLADDLCRLAWLCVDPPERAEHLAQAGDLWSLSGDARAEGAYRAAVRAFPPSAAAGPDARRVLLSDGRAARIESHLSAAADPRRHLGQPVRQAEAHLALGRLLAASDDRRGEAVDHLLRAATLADGPGSVALDVLGGLHDLGESWGEMLTRLETDASERADGDPQAAALVLRRLARACLAEPPILPRAEAALKRLLAIAPEDAGAAEALVGVLTAQRKHREAAELLTDLSKVTEGTTAALYLVRAGVLHLARFGDRQASLACFEDALARDPGYRPAATHLKEAYRETGRWSDLARVMLAEVEGRPVDAEVIDLYRSVGKMLRDEAGDIAAAAEVYKRIIAHDSMDDDAVRFFEAFHERIDTDGRTTEHLAAAAREASSPEARRTALLGAAEAAVRLGAPVRARGYLESALAQAPGDTEARARYFDLLAEWGDFRALARALDAERARVGEASDAWPTLVLRLGGVRLERLGDIEGARRAFESVARRGGEAGERARERLRSLDAGLAAASAYTGATPGPEILERRAGPVPPAPATTSPAPPIATGPAPAAPPPAAGAAATPDSDEEPAEPGDVEGTPAEPGEALAVAQAALDKGDFERALFLADAAADHPAAGMAVVSEARELAANILIDYLGDAEEGLDRLAELGRDRRLPVALRRRVNEARVRLLDRDVAHGAARDRALALALADAAATAKSPDEATSFSYRQAQLLIARHEDWRAGADLLTRLLVDEPDNRAILESLSGVYEREEQWGPLTEVLEQLAELDDDEGAAEAYGHLADIAVDDLGDPDLARRYLVRSLERLPGHLPALKTLVRLAREAGDHETEATSLRAWIAAETDHSAIPPLEYALAEALEAAGRFGEAATHYERVLAEAPDSAAARVALERLATELSDPEDRARVLDVGARHAPDAAEAATLHVARGRTLLHELDDAAGARAAAEAALEADANDLSALSLLREIADRRGAPAAERAALLHREVWAARSPKDAADRYVELAALELERGGERKTAAGFLDQALEAEPDHPRALSSLARLELEDDEPEAARPYLERLAAAQSAPPEVRAWARVRLALVLEDAGAYPEALDGFTAATDLDPDGPEGLLGLARLATKLGKDDVALRSLTRVAQLGEAGVQGAPAGADLADVYARLGALHRRIGNDREAARAYQKALDRDALHREALRTLAVLNEEAGEWSAAAEMRERAAKLITDRTMRAAALAAVGGFIRDRVGDHKRALDAFRQAVNLVPDEAAYHASVLALARRLGRPGEARAAALECVRLAADGPSAAEYLAAAADCADAEHDLDGAHDLARAALERDPACQAALDRAVPVLESRGETEEAAGLLARAAEVAGTDEARLKFILEQVRVLQDGGEPEAAAAALARAVAIAPGDEALLVTLADGPPPPADAAREALPAVAAEARRHRLEVPRLAAVEVLASGAGDPDRAYLAGALLNLMRTGPRPVLGRVADLRASLPERPTGVLPPQLRQALSPAEIHAGVWFYAAAEAVLLDLPEDARLLTFPTSAGNEPEPEWIEEMAAVTRALGANPLELRVAEPGVGIRVAPRGRRLHVAEDLLAGRLPGERRFVLGFGLTLGADGHRWVTAGGDGEAVLESLRGWARRKVDADTALDLAERFGSGVQSKLAAAAGGSVPPAADFLDAAVAEAARLGLVVAGDLLQGLVAAIRVLAPGAELPRSPEALVALAGSTPALADLLDLVHDDSFLAARLAVGVALTAA